MAVESAGKREMELPGLEESPLAARQRMIQLVWRVWPWLFLVGLVIFFSIFGPGFFSVRSSMNVLTAASHVLLMALGQTFVIIAAGIDLSTGWVVGLASVTGAVVMRDLYASNGDEMLAIVAGIVAGLLVTLIPGFVNGILIAKVRIPAFIATMGMGFIVRGAALILSGGNVVPNLPPGLRTLGNESLLYVARGQLYFLNKPEDLAQEELRTLVRIIPYPVLIALVTLLVCHWVLSRTQFGRHTYAIGGNPEAALRAGIRVDRHTIMLYMLSAFTSGLGGIVYTARFAGGSYRAGEEALLMSIAAIVIGGTSLFGGEGTFTGTVVGARIIAVMQTGLVSMAVDPFWQFIAVGVVVVVAVMVDQARSRVMEGE